MKLELLAPLILSCFAVGGCRIEDEEHFSKVAATLPSVKLEAEKQGVVTSAEKLQELVDKDATGREWAVVDAAVESYSKAALGFGLNMDTMTRISRNLPADRAFNSQKFELISPKLDEVVKALGGKHVRIYRDWASKSVFDLVVFPEYTEIKIAVRMLTLRAVWHSSFGRKANAISDLRAAQLLGNISNSDPTMISHMVAVACDSIASKGWENCLAILKADQDFINRSRPFMDGSSQKYGYFNVAGEILFKLETFQYIGKPEMKGIFTDEENKEVPLPNVKPDILRAAYTVRAIESNFVIKKAYEMKGFKESDALLKSFEAKITASKDKSLHFEQENIELFTSVNNVRFTSQNLAKCRLAMMDVLTFKNKNGRYPKSLEDAGVKILDAFTGEPFKYKLTPNGAVVYSVGQDMVDNGGESKSVDGQRDIVITYPYLPDQRDN